MAQITIGGEVHTVSLSNFDLIERAWPILAPDEKADPSDWRAAIRKMLELTSFASDKPMTVAELRSRLAPDEMWAAARSGFTTDLMREIMPKGEAAPAEGEASLSTATSTESTSLSPELPEAPTGA